MQTIQHINVSTHVELEWLPLLRETVQVGSTVCMLMTCDSRLTNGLDRMHG